WIKWGIAGSVATAVLVMLDALFFEKYFFQINTYSVGNANSTEKLKLLFLTDLHFRKKLWPFHRRLARKINSLMPDLILITGDVIDKTGQPAPARRFFNLISYHIPKVAILGNHDHKGRVHTATFKKIYEQHNCTLLINESKAFTIGGMRLMITGVDDFIEGNPAFKQAVQNIEWEEHHILLVHSPLQGEAVHQQIETINAERSKENHINISYILAGHNHGGQVRFFGYAPVQPEMSGPYLNGWYSNDKTHMYISKGFGTSAIPFRFGARSEVTVFDYGV
ncbi:MAG: metallophosphoesterase, partial [Flavisolibacter sp.]|nr:metallophosphoesterase [Flavisolibacter sp.]